MKTSLHGLSPKAKELAEKVGKGGSVTKALTEDPSLIEGLDEYQKWRDREQQAISCETQQPAMSHEISKILKKVHSTRK